MPEPLSLSQGVRLATSLCRPLPAEKMHLNLALGRVAATRLVAAQPVPPFAQAARDGYAIRHPDHRKILPVVGEIPAGCNRPPACLPGQALRIMTGAPVPNWCDQIVPLEDARETETRLTISGIPQTSHIRPPGCDLARGQIIARRGELLTPEHLALAAGSGVTQVQVHRRPQVAVLCTGSELTDSGSVPRPGQIYSANLVLLQGLIRENGGEITYLETAPDQPELICRRISTILSTGPSLLITTGGTGPGRYDLLARVFAELEVSPLITGLAVKPGQHTRVGQHGETLLCALPGPPPAVRLLFNEVVRPLLFKLGGRPGVRPLKARLREPLSCKGRAIMNLKGGNYTLDNGMVTVRQTGRGEPSNCVLVLPARTRNLAAGTWVTIHPAR